MYIKEKKKRRLRVKEKKKKCGRREEEREKELRLNEGRRGNKDREGDSIKDKRKHEDTWCGNEKGRT